MGVLLNLRTARTEAFAAQYMNMNCDLCQEASTNPTGIMAAAKGVQNEKWKVQMQNGSHHNVTPLAAWGAGQMGSQVFVRELYPGAACSRV